MLSKHNDSIKVLYRAVGRFIHLATGDEWIYNTDFYTDKAVAKAQFTRRFGKTPRAHKAEYNRNTGTYDKVYECQETYLEEAHITWSRV